MDGSGTGVTIRNNHYAVYESSSGIFGHIFTRHVLAGDDLLSFIDKFGSPKRFPAALSASQQDYQPNLRTHKVMHIPVVRAPDFPYEHHLLHHVQWHGRCFEHRRNHSLGVILGHY